MPGQRRKKTIALRLEPDALARIDAAVAERKKAGRPLANRNAFIAAAADRAVAGESFRSARPKASA